MSGTRKTRTRTRVLAGGIAVAALASASNIAGAAGPPPEPAPTLFMGNVRVAEYDAGRHVAKIPITLSAPFESDAWFTFETIDDGKGGATPGVDYKSMRKRKKIKAGVTATTVTVPIYGDTEVEDDELVEFRISRLDAPPVALVKDIGAIQIVDDDTGVADGPTVSASSNLAFESDAGQRKLQVVFGLSEPQSSDVLVTWKTVAATATPGSDFKNVVTKTTRIKAGRVQKTNLVTIYGDTEAEGNDELQVVITGVTGGDGVVANNIDSGLIVIGDDDTDSDGDRLVDWAEFFLNTDSSNTDSDGDLLSDGEEVRYYFTNPNLMDTDGDGADDYLEIKLGTDPNDPSSTPPAV